MKYKSGFLLGKFYPVHLGHIYLIEEAAKRCEELTVLVCCLREDKEPYISGQKRYESIYEYFKFHKNIKIIFHEDNSPQYPEDHPRFWNIWLKIVLTYVNPSELSVVFSSEEYGNTFAEKLGINHECIDLNREAINISGTKIRNDLYGNWDFLPQTTKRHFIKKVAILGPESCGKSTLVKRLSEKFSFPMLEEYGRTYYEEHNGITSQHSFAEIIERHNTKLLELKNRAEKPVILSDTDYITTKVFYDLYYPQDQVLDLYRQPMEEYDYRILLYPDNKASQDGTRQFISNSQRISHFNLITQELFNRNLKYIIVKGSYEEKFDTCSEIIKKILNNQTN